MPLQHLGFVDLPPHAGSGGFDHAAVHESTGRIYVAHTANDAVDVIDIEARKHLLSIPGLSAVAGARVGPAADHGLTSNRGENTVGIFPISGQDVVDKLEVGVRPNGLAYDSTRHRLLVAHAGDPVIPGSCTVSVVDARARRRVADIPVAGRTRWAVYDPVADAFHVNIADPPQIAVIEPGDPVCIRRSIAIPYAGPHGLDIDVRARRLFCACDAAVLAEVDTDTGAVVATERLAGAPDVVFFNPARKRLYVAVGDPGLIQVFGTAPLRLHETITTERGAHTISFDGRRDMVCAFLPASHRAAVYQET